MNIVTGPFIVTMFALSGALLVVLLVRPPSKRWLVTSLAAVACGGMLAVVTWLILVRWMHVVPIPLSHVVYFWFAATLVAVAVAVANLWRSRWWRKAIAALSVIVFLVTGSAAVNAVFGIDRTFGQFLGVTVPHPIPLTPPTAAAGMVSDYKPLAATWEPPSDMPRQGRVGTEVIPGTVSGFHARPAGIYLPPAALVPGAPALPLVIMMMGQPGNPDPHFAAKILDEFAARHNGLAPIVIVADQLGSPSVDTLCLNTTEFGRVETYITKDVVDWALANLNVTHDHRYWTIAGYSNGGQCAISMIAKHPKLWSNVLDISGEEFPGSDYPAPVLRNIFHGDRAAYDAQKPINILAKIKLPGTFGVFTVGSNDYTYLPGVRRTYAAASDAGMDAVYYEVPNGGHVLRALNGGLRKGFGLLYPRLGLSTGMP
ncbi:alpha/beta hydrolase-fold protein [Humibacter antri]